MKLNVDLFSFLEWVASDLLWLTWFPIFCAAYFYSIYLLYINHPKPLLKQILIQNCSWILHPTFIKESCLGVLGKWEFLGIHYEISFGNKGETGKSGNLEDIANFYLVCVFCNCPIPLHSSATENGTAPFFSLVLVLWTRILPWFAYLTFLTESAKFALFF